MKRKAAFELAAPQRSHRLGGGYWHRAWQSKFDPRDCEVQYEAHRVDVQLNTNVILELQHS